MPRDQPRYDRAVRWRLPAPVVLAALLAGAALHAQVVKDTGSKVTVTVFPKANANGELTRAVLDVSQGWQVEELHTEEGRLDEVFRSITMPDTKQEAAK